MKQLVSFDLETNGLQIIFSGVRTVPFVCYLVRLIANSEVAMSYIDALPTKLGPLNDDGDTLTTTYAGSSNRSLQMASVELVGEVSHDTSTTCTSWMTKRDGTTVNVCFFGVQA